MANCIGSRASFRFSLLSINIIVLSYIFLPLLYKSDVNKCLRPQALERTEENRTSQLTMEFPITSHSTTWIPAEVPSDYLMAIMVSSSAKSLDRRDGIRLSWMKGKTSEVLLKFSIGTTDLSPDEKENLRIEQDDHGDLLLLSDLDDSDHTKKVLASYVELDAHYNCSYVLKCDDDTFVALDKVLSELKEKDPGRSLYWGYHLNRSQVPRTGKDAESNWFLCNTYVPFALKFGYILSHDLVRRIASNAGGCMLYKNEGASVGVWVGPYKMQRLHDKRFRKDPNSINCKKDLVIPSQSVAQMIRRQKSLNEKGNICTYEK